jgi:hypothetical protein
MMDEDGAVRRTGRPQRTVEAGELVGIDRPGRVARPSRVHAREPPWPGGQVPERLAFHAHHPGGSSWLPGSHRSALGAGWVSHILQRLTLAIRDDRRTPALVQRAERAYHQRRSGAHS